jgi:hypothetical protein
MQMKPYLIGQGVFSFVDGSMMCPSPHNDVSSTSLAFSSGFPPAFLTWKQQDQLILSALLSFLSTDVLHLVVDCPTSASGGICALQLNMVLHLSDVTAAASSSNNVGLGSRIVQIGSKVEPVMLVSGSDRLSANFTIYLGTPHSNAPSLCNMVITPLPTSHSVTHPQKILPLGFLTPAPINMLLQILLV